MAGLQTYLIFSGNCEEAVKFYCDIFKGEVLFTSRYGETPVGTPENWKNKIIHTVFKIRGTEVLASDYFPGMNNVIGTNVHLCVNYDKNTDPTEAFNKLAEGGKITMPLQKTFWARQFGQLVDRYGIGWMFNQAEDKPN